MSAFVDGLGVEGGEAMFVPMETDWTGMLASSSPPGQPLYAGHGSIGEGAGMTTGGVSEPAEWNFDEALTFTEEQPGPGEASSRPAAVHTSSSGHMRHSHPGHGSASGQDLLYTDAQGQTRFLGPSRWVSFPGKSLS